MVSVGVEEVDPDIRKMDVPIEVRQVVLERPALDFTLRPVRSAIGIRIAAIALVEPLLILAFEPVVQGHVVDAITPLEKALDLVQVRLEDLRVMLQLARFDEAGVKLLPPLILPRIVLAWIAIVFPPMRLQQTLAAVRQEHRDVPLPGHPSGADETQFAEMPQFAVPRVQRAIIAVAEVVCWDNSEGADGGQRAALGAAQRVLPIAVEHPLAFGPVRQVELALERVSRVRTVAVTRVAIARIFVALSGIFSSSRIMLEHGRVLE